MSHVDVKSPTTKEIEMRVQSRQRVYIAALIVAGVVAILGIIVVASAKMSLPNGEPLFSDPGTLIGTVITALGGTAAAALGVMKSFDKRTERVEKDTAIIKENVQNSHNTGLRDNLDTNHAEVLHAQALQSERIDGLEELMKTGMSDIREAVRHMTSLHRDSASDVRGIRRDIGRNTDTTMETARRVTLIELEVAQVKSRQSAALRQITELSDNFDLETTERTKEILEEDEKDERN